MSAGSDGFARHRQCHDKHACGRREQLRDSFRHCEVEAEERDLGGVFVDEDNDQQVTVYSPPMTENRPELSSSCRSYEATTPVVAQGKTSNNCCCRDPPIW
jgi:hypothetical protein